MNFEASIRILFPFRNRKTKIAFRYNLTTMPAMVEADLLPQFTALTNMQPNMPIPAYLRLDANLFFHNIACFRVPETAPSPAVQASVAPVPAASALVVAPALPAEQTFLKAVRKRN